MDAAIQDTFVVILTRQQPHRHRKNGSITLKIEAYGNVQVAIGSRCALRTCTPLVRHLSRLPNKEGLEIHVPDPAWSQNAVPCQYLWVHM